MREVMIPWNARVHARFAAGAGSSAIPPDPHDMPTFPDTFGLEEEYFLVHPGNRRLVRRVPQRLLAAFRARFGDVVCPELLQSQLEVASPVFRHTHEARERMRALREGVAEVAASFGYRLVSAGTHPLSAWQAQAATSGTRYAKLMEDFQIIGRRNVLCGLHVHCGVPADTDRVQLMNRLMPWLPFLLALSASSPFWGGQPTGLSSYRQAAYDEWPRTGIPDEFDDQAAYDRFVAQLVAQGAIRDGSFLWWAIRPSLAFPTLELRICDACTRVDDALAIAALFRCLVRLHLRQPARGGERSPGRRRLIDENRWRARRWGTAASFLPEDGGDPVPAPVLWRRLRRDLAEDIAALDCADEITRIDQILRDGCSADAQLAVYQQRRAAGGGRSRAVQAVVDWLADTTADVRPRRRSAAA